MEPGVLGVHGALAATIRMERHNVPSRGTATVTIQQNQMEERIVRDPQLKRRLVKQQI